MKGVYFILIFLPLLLTLSCTVEVSDKKHYPTEGMDGGIEKPVREQPEVEIPQPNLEYKETNITKNNIEPKTDLKKSNFAFVEIKDMKFMPRELNISTNTTVIWINIDWSGYYGRNHMVVSNTNKFRSSRILYNETFSFTFTEPGTYKYLDPTYRSGTTGGILIRPGIIYVE